MRIALVGAGKMGGALLRGWRDSAVAEVTIIDPASWAEGTLVSPEQLPSGYKPDAVVLAVKPQAMPEVAPHYARFTGALVISIAAGISLDKLAGWVGKDTAIVRAMPNLPAMVGQGVTVCVASAKATQEQKAQAETLMHAAGTVHWLEDEALMDAVTAVSGSGPAYLFYFVEALTQAAQGLGLPVEIAKDIVNQTICGSASLLREAQGDAAALREQVTSKGGTTEAGLKILMGSEGLQQLMENTVRAAEARSRELNTARN